MSLRIDGDVATFFWGDEVEACVLVIRLPGGAFAFQGGQEKHHEILLYLLGVSP